MDKKKTVVITGGANGIGLAAVHLFLAQGDNVSIWDIKKDNALSLFGDKMIADRLQFCKVNVASMEDCEQATKDTINKFDSIEVLINNAGITRDAPLVKMVAKQWQDVLDVNLTGIFNTTKCVLPQMIEKKFGKIINTSSVVAHSGNYGQANYAATKGAVISFTKTLAKEVGKNNITVNAVAPGFIETDIIKTIPSKILQSIVAASSLRKAGKAEDVAKAYRFLASEDAAYITGAVLNVDGGLTF